MRSEGIAPDTPIPAHSRPFFWATLYSNFSDCLQCLKTTAIPTDSQVFGRPKRSLSRPIPISQTRKSDSDRSINSGKAKMKPQFEPQNPSRR
ncbi:hypothetical protein L596_025643 [Steinernema carpocapsae]|uniref:Uncharacterized protein n=1 Tax=Steinernema carpocapsae TaxID=34508 RepID=A0A4U5M8D7_STECR|nr:hypothetical protein L596_025643 [Steinernema carpocapsae]